MEKVIEQIKNKLEGKNTIIPFLFTWNNLEILNKEVENLALNLLKSFEIPKIYLYKFEDNWENIKIKELKEFVEFWNSTPPYKFQIFFIENISRLTLASSNSLLKFFEEPWITNIIFTTNVWENWVLETILSRVQIIDLWLNKTSKKNSYFQNIISNHLEWNNNELISYFYKSKLEKDEYINFLENLIIYAKENLVFISFLEEINQDINLIKKNNVNARYVVDKWILKI